MSNPVPLPFPARIFNATAKTFGLPRPPDPDLLVKKARRKTGLDDFGDDSFYHPLQKLIESAKREADLTPLGWFVLNIRLGTILCNNLRTRHIFKHHPEIFEQELAPPIFISGLQRTGTTFLQRIMASDPAVRPLYSWEGLNPAPRIKFNGSINRKHLQKDINSRIKIARWSASALRFLSPGFYSIHPVEYDGPEEDVLLMDHSFISTVPEATMHVPSFSHWLEEQDQTPSYKKLKELLQLLQWQSGGRHWILKTPHHLEWFEYLFETFPDARVIMTHRDPVTAVASFASMVHHSWAIFSETADPVRAGRHWFGKVKRMLDRALQFGSADDPRFIDISYYNLVADPLGTVSGIYDSLAMPMNHATQEKMKETITAHRKNRFGKHLYKIEDYGIGPDEAREAFSEYRTRFSIPHEYYE